MPETLVPLRDPQFQELVKRKNAISLALTVVMLAAYFGFMATLAFAPQVFAAPFGNATRGIPIGIGVIVLAWVLTGIYVRWANTKYDAMIQEFKNRNARENRNVRENPNSQENA